MEHDLFAEIQDGRLLFNLLEVLSGEDLSAYGRLTRGTMRIQLVANCAISFKFLAQHVKLVDVGPTDVVDGNRKVNKERGGGDRNPIAVPRPASGVGLGHAGARMCAHFTDSPFASPSVALGTAHPAPR